MTENPTSWRHLMIEMSKKSTWELQAIVEALAYLEFLNTREEDDRLMAARHELARRNKP